MSLELDIWSDIACPWCYVGKRRLERALDDYDGDVRVRWRAFELDPSAPLAHEGSYVERLGRKYRRSKVEAQRMIDGMTETAAGEGLDFRFDRIRSGNTFDAHRLLRWAWERSPDRQGALKERLMAAYLNEGRLMSDRETLLEAVSAVELDRDEADEVLSSDAFRGEVRADEAAAAQLGIRGVPFFVVERRIGLSGAQPSDVILRALEEGRPEAPAIVCTADGCAS